MDGETGKERRTARSGEEAVGESSLVTSMTRRGRGQLQTLQLGGSVSSTGSACRLPVPRRP